MAIYVYFLLHKNSILSIVFFIPFFGAKTEFEKELKIPASIELNPSAKIAPEARL